MAIMEQRILKGVFAQKKGVALAELHMLLEKVISNTTNQGTLLISVISTRSYTVRLYPNSEVQIPYYVCAKCPSWKS